MHFIKSYFKQISIVRYLFSEYLYRKRLYYFKRNPKKLTNETFKKVFKRDIDWENPTNLIEKIMWLQFNTDTSLWTKCADKLLVREYVKECGCGYLLNKLYGNWTDVNTIDFNTLPKEFVLKSNNGCGTVLIVKDKSKISTHTITKILKKWLSRPYGMHNGQLHYLKMKPCIIAEEILNQGSDFSSLIDFKIWCFNGKPELILVVYDRCDDYVYICPYDLDWNPHHEYSVYSDHYRKGTKVLPKPKSLPQILEACVVLSKPFKQVRIDFYEIEDKPIFGEMTFTTGYGYFTDEYYDYLGSKIDISELQKHTD